jgi:hypothetical protein
VSCTPQIRRWVLADSHLVPQEIVLVARRTARLRGAAELAGPNSASRLGRLLDQVRQVVRPERATAEVLAALDAMARQVDRLRDVGPVQPPARELTEQVRQRMARGLAAGERHPPVGSRDAAAAILQRSLSPSAGELIPTLDLPYIDTMAALDARDFARVEAPDDVKGALAAIVGNVRQLSGYAEGVLLFGDGRLLAALGGEPPSDPRIATSSVQLRVAHAEQNPPSAPRPAAVGIQLRSVAAHRAAQNLDAGLFERLAAVDLRDFELLRRAAESKNDLQRALAALTRNLGALPGYRNFLRDADL